MMYKTMKTTFIWLLLTISFSFSNGKTGMVKSFSFPQGNMIENGGFEKNTNGIYLDGWRYTSASTDNKIPLWMPEGERARSGAGMLGLYYAPQSTVQHGLSDFFPVQPGKIYTLFVWYKTVGYNPTSGSIVSGIIGSSENNNWSNTGDTQSNWVLSEGSLDGRSKAYENTDGEWILHVHTFKTRSSHRYGRVSLLWTSGTGYQSQFFFDDVLVVPGEHSASDYSKLKPSVSHKYLNGSNKVIQTIQEDGERDIVTQTVYDKLGRVEKITMPIPVSQGNNKHQYVSGFSEESDVLKNFYNGTNSVGEQVEGLRKNAPDAGNVAYAKTRYENSPLGRVVESSKPGSAWEMGVGRTQKTCYSSVSSIPTNSTQEGALNPCDGYEANGKYFVVQYISEDSSITREYKNKIDQLIQKSSKINGFWIRTNYEYDSQGNLITILAPVDERGKRLTTHMRYNTLGQLIEEETPATGVTEFKYDVEGRLRFHRTENQKTKGRFSYSKYDKLGRVTETGEFQSPQAGDLFYSEVNNTFFPEKHLYVTYRGGAEGLYQQTSTIFVRTLNHYDTELPEKFGCPREDNIDISDARDAYLDRFDNNTSGFFTEYDLQNDEYEDLESANSSFETSYNNAKDNCTYTPCSPGNISIYNLSNAIINTPSGGVDLIHPENGSVTFTFENIPPAAVPPAPGSDQMPGYLKEQLHSYYPSSYLKGKLVASASCNYELRGEGEQGEVVKLFNYDKYGNVINQWEYNTFAPDVDELLKGTYVYDVQNRLKSKDLGGEHEEYIEYDHLSRVQRVRPKWTVDHITVENKYNHLGQLSHQFLGAGQLSEEQAVNSLMLSYEYHLHGGLKNLKTFHNQVSWTSSKWFEESLNYENTFDTKKYDGTITGASYFYNIPGVLDEAEYYDYVYDDLNRLTDAYLGNETNASYQYTYRDDGRIYTLTRNGNQGVYQYNDKGQLLKVNRSVTETDKRGEHLTPSQNWFQYDKNGNMITDYSKGELNTGSTLVPLAVSYRSDNLPYKFEYLDKESQEVYTLLMGYDEAGQRIVKKTKKGASQEHLKSYFSMGKESKENHEGGLSKVYDMHSGVGRYTYTSACQVSLDEFVNGVLENGTSSTTHEKFCNLVTPTLTDYPLCSDLYETCNNIYASDCNNHNGKKCYSASDETLRKREFYVKDHLGTTRMVYHMPTVDEYVDKCYRWTFQYGEEGAANIVIDDESDFVNCDVYNVFDEYPKCVDDFSGTPGELCHEFAKLDNQLVLGEVNWAATYTPYGKQNELVVSSASNNNDVTQKFTGKELDEGIELSYFGARYYDADLGMWTAADNARQFHGLYSYGDPINAIDPDGNVKLTVMSKGRAGVMNTDGAANVFAINLNGLARTMGKYYEGPAKGIVSSGLIGLANTLDKVDMFFGGEGRNSFKAPFSNSSIESQGGGIVGGGSISLSFGLFAGDGGSRTHGFFGSFTKGVGGVGRFYQSLNENDQTSGVGGSLGISVGAEFGVGLEQSVTTFFEGLGE